MKKTCTFLSMLILLFSMQSCWYQFVGDDDILTEPAEQSMYEPVYTTRAALNESVALQPPMSIGNSGKIYIKDHYLFIGEKYLGFHVIDNSDPANPTQVAFIKVPGATDIAIKNNIIYINNAVDLVALNVDYMTQNLEVVKRIEDTFPQLQSPDGFEFTATDDQIIVNWTLIQ